MNEIKVYKESELTHLQNKIIGDVLFTRHNKIVDIGDYLLDRDGLYARVTGFELTDNPNEEKEKRYSVKIKIKGIRYSSESNIEDYYINKYTVWKGTLQALQESAQKMLTGEIEKPEAKVSNDQGMMSFDKETFSTLKQDMILRKDEMMSRMRMMEEMMKDKLRELELIVKPMMEEIARVTKIIWTIELYLGIKEDIELFQDGEEADLEEPIHFLQERLYMDEELGDPSNGGMDIKTIDDFFNWAVKFNDYFQYNNFELLLPYKKCVRIMKVRRYEKDYGDPWINLGMKELNEITFIFIRNGQKLYCIKTDMEFGDKLFPAESELMDLRDKILKDSENVISRNGRLMNDQYRKELIEEKLTEVVDKYKRNLIIMQGLVDRTEVFGKLFGIVNIMNTSALTKGQVIFEYDADTSNQIQDGDMDFDKKFQKMRDQIGHGTRVLWGGCSPSENDGRFFRLWRNWYPQRPPGGLYELMEDKEQNESYSQFKLIYIMYLPSDEVYDEVHGGYKKRKKRESFQVLRDECVDIDFFSWRDMDWLNKMFHDRRLRKRYESYIYSLKSLKDFKEKELELEQPFAELLANKISKPMEEVMDAIHWWKTKNKYKRAIMVDDAKAFRMITKELLKNEKNFK